MTVRRILSFVIALALALIPVSARAQNGMTVGVTVSVTCDRAALRATVSEGFEPYTLAWDFGDAEMREDPGLAPEDFPFEVVHTYSAPGDYVLELLATDSTGATAETSETVVIDGPSVTLTSEPFPPLVTLESGEATVDFSAQVSGGPKPYTFSWDLDGDGDSDSDEAGDATFTYIEAGKYQASVLVTDDCGLKGMDTLPVVVIDPDEEACHPMAQRIADAVSTLFPGQANDLYTCEDIFSIFRGGLTGSQTGFGRLWHAYKLTQTIQDLTWEEIRDWHLDGNGWGGLVQLNRFAETLEQHGIRELVGLVLSGDATLREIRHSVRSVLRHEADFEDALTRLQGGMSPGELGRFYRTAQDLELDASQLDGYLMDGALLQELSHAARLAERSNTDWTEVADAHAAGYSWGEIGQAQRLADGEDWMSLLDAGIRETREQMREDDRTEREQERIDRTAERLARQYGVSESQVWSLYDGSCAGSWSCVRAELRAESGRVGGKKDKN